ncbi:hypothetical protein HAX54_048568, partial [Datura stramonium]|nr:hypothetical protein [Datura stramonium]
CGAGDGNEGMGLVRVTVGCSGEGEKMAACMERERGKNERSGDVASPETVVVRRKRGKKREGGVGFPMVAGENEGEKRKGKGGRLERGGGCPVVRRRL